MSALEISACRCCGHAALQSVLSLGVQHLTGVFPRSPDEKVTSGPLELVKCVDADGCGLLQLKHTYDSLEMYGTNYGYRSGLNQSMVRHLGDTVASIVAKYPPSPGAIVLDVGSNDGTLLSFMPSTARRVGMDPTIAKYGKYYAEGIQKVATFFSAQSFRANFGDGKAEIITSIAMFYDLDDPLAFVRDIAAVLAPEGIWYFEQSYLLTMLTQNAYDTICHEHLEYYALRQIVWMMERCGLRVIDVQLNNVNGGSFSVAVCHNDASHRANSAAIDSVKSREEAARLDELEPYHAFAQRVVAHRDALMALIADIRARGESVIGYGASTKGNVILQYCGLTSADIPAIAEVNPDKYGAFTPGTHIPIISEAEAHALKPDYFLVMPWHFRENLIGRETAYLASGGKMIFPLPEISVVSA
jgi:SAM-dependent methyltransferase